MINELNLRDLYICGFENREKWSSRSKKTKFSHSFEFFYFIFVKTIVKRRGCTALVSLLVAKS